MNAERPPRIADGIPRVQRLGFAASEGCTHD